MVFHRIRLMGSTGGLNQLCQMWWQSIHFNGLDYVTSIGKQSLYLFIDLMCRHYHIAVVHRLVSVIGVMYLKCQSSAQWRRSQVKSGGQILRTVKGWGLGRGCALPSWGSGACPQKKNQFCAKIMQFWASFGTYFLYYSRKWGIISQSWKWGRFLCPDSPPPAPTPMYIGKYTGSSVF